MSNDNKSNEHKGTRTLILSIATALFSITLFDVMFGFSKIIDPGISKIYNYLGTSIEPNMITLVVFDWRGYDTLGESLILVTAVIVVLLIFGRGLVDGDTDEDVGITKNENENITNEEEKQ
ncbi:EhbH [Methanobrevibacter sp. TMH8]|uniref:EhbH n=1 Tax=Methanobrevibacter sp. TMH8 TaxID=2848611 RepID=UPI001CCE084F|nr:EhbH [Methanobrevibacter sp. TMH8]MBZ9571392.1 EhbH [Methanobrevibacter sp. TMH8]